jgi:hypothetical protein
VYGTAEISKQACVQANKGRRREVASLAARVLSRKQIYLTLPTPLRTLHQSVTS